MVSVFRGTIEFFNELGMYDVILPFLLVFTIVYGILEKTKIFGMVKIQGEESPQKGLNAIVAFAIAMLFVASTKLVEALIGTIAKFVILLLLPILFLILVGAFHTGKEEFQLKGWTKTAFYIILFLGIILIFLGQFGWLELGYDWLLRNWDSKILSSVGFLVIMIGAIFAIVRDPKPSTDKKKKSED